MERDRHHRQSLCQIRCSSFHYHAFICSLQVVQYLQNHHKSYIFLIIYISDTSCSFNPSLAAAAVMTYCCAAVAGTHPVTLNQKECF
jgi:hypothetical protein